MATEAGRSLRTILVGAAILAVAGAVGGGLTAWRSVAVIESNVGHLTADVADIKRSVQQICWSIGGCPPEKIRPTAAMRAP